MAGPEAGPAGRARRHYALDGEDALLWAVFAGRTDGTFIEVGAFDGRYLSNTLSFEEQGWTGICVEAHPDYAPLCAANRPRSACVHAACVGPGAAPSLRFLAEPLGILSGLQADRTPNMEWRYGLRGMTFPGFREIEVPARTLDDIIAEHRPELDLVDILSIDVEGTEIDVLRGFSRDARVIIAEANTGPEGEALDAYLATRGYARARRLGPNRIYAREPELAAALRAVGLEVEVERVIHPLGEAATPPQHSGRRVLKPEPPAAPPQIR